MEFPLDLYPSQTLTLLLLLGVSPSSLQALRAAATARTLNAALLDASLIASPATLLSAANRAALARARGAKGVTDSPHTDLVVALHGGRNIAEALRALAPRPGASAVLLAVCSRAAAVEGLRALAPEATQGVLGDFYAPGSPAVDAAAIAALYKCSAEELALHSSAGTALEAAVLARIGAEA